MTPASDESFLSALPESQMYCETNIVESVARTRIEKARNLRQNPHMRISEIASDVGFQSLSQFNRAFEKVTGKTFSLHWNDERDS